MKKRSRAKAIITALARLLEQRLSSLTFSLGQRYHGTCFFKLRNFLSNICINMPIVNWLLCLSCVLHCVDSLCCSISPPRSSPSHGTSPFRMGKHVVEGTWHETVLHGPTALTEQGLGDSTPARKEIFEGG